MSLSFATAESPQLVTILENLDQPTGLAIIPSANNPSEYQIAIAEGGQGAVLLCRQPGVATTLVDDLSPGQITLESTNDGSLLASSSKVLFLGKETTNEVPINYESLGEATPSVGRNLVDMALSNRYFFAIYEGKLLRSQRNVNRFSALRFFPLNPSFGSSKRMTSLAFNEKGYLVVAYSEDEHTALAFCNPYEKAPYSTIRVEGLSRIDSLAYGSKRRPAERRLYALLGNQFNSMPNAAEQNVPEQKGAQPNMPMQQQGLYRLDAMPPANGQLTCQAELVVPLDRPLAFAMAPDGTAYFLALTADGVGVLLHADFAF